VISRSPTFADVQKQCVYQGLSFSAVRRRSLVYSQVVHQLSTWEHPLSRTQHPQRSGTVWHNKARKRWEAKVTIRAPEPIGWDDDGKITKWKHHRRTVIASTKQEAVSKAARLTREIALDLDSAAPLDMTVGQWFEIWIDEILPLADISDVTRRGYIQIARLYVLPHVGDVGLEDLAPAHVRRMMSTLQRKGKSANTIRQARAVLRRGLRVAEQEGHVNRNAAMLVDGIKVPRSEGEVLDPAAARALLQAVDEYEIGPLVAILLLTGLRKGEALGLGWSSIDLDSSPATLTVSRALKRGDRDTLYLDEPKTSGSRRTIHLPPLAVGVLRKHLTEQIQRRLAFGSEWGLGWPDDLVFTSTVGTPLGPNRCNRLVKAMTLAVLDRELTPHRMRHSAASLLIAADVPLKTISDSLGHSSIRVTSDIYGHLFSPAKADAANAMQQILEGSYDESN
jgi:integrase